MYLPPNPMQMLPYARQAIPGFGYPYYPAVPRIPMPPVARIAPALPGLLSLRETRTKKTKPKKDVYTRMAEDYSKPIQTNLLAPRPQNTPDMRRFVVIGDCGSGDMEEFEIAFALRELYKKKPFKTILLLGDNVYEDGAPEKFRRALYQPYKWLLDRGVKIFPVLGNHDVDNPVSKDGNEQLKYMGAKRYYNFTIAGGDVEFFALDTTIMLPGYAGCYEEHQREAHALNQKQLRWLEKKLSRSKAKHKIVYGHYPLYSSGYHYQKTPEIFTKLRSMLKNTLEKHDVELYLAGHEHHYERSAPINGVTYVTAGGSVKDSTVPFSNNTPQQRAFGTNEDHFLFFELTPDGLVQEILDEELERLEEEPVVFKPSGNYSQPRLSLNA